MRILGIETSCDDTTAAVVEDGRHLLSNVLATSADIHIEYGGVVPEIAARSHIEAINPVIQKALAKADCTWDDIDGIAVTYGAGLGGSLLVGVSTARTLAIALKKPLYAVNHVEAHLYVNFLTSSALPGYVLRETQPEFPMLGVIVSGGHSQLVLFEDHFRYTLLGQTRDDAIGEAFDKVAKMLGLPYPGGPSVSKKALGGNPAAYGLPISQLGPRQVLQASVDLADSKNNRRRAIYKSTVKTQSPDDAMRGLVASGKYDFSYSGLKTAVLRLAQTETGNDYTFPSWKLSEALDEAQKADIAASFQYTAVKTIVDKVKLAVEEFAPASVVIGGGVAASPELRRQLSEALPLPISYTDPRLCTDNGAMVATLGCFKAMLGAEPADPYTLDIAPNLSM